MKKHLLLFMLAVNVSIYATAQDQKGAVEIFGGYSYTSYPIFQIYSGPWSRTGFSGWDASAAYNFAPHVALEGDFSGGYASYSAASYSDNLHTYMAGPRFSTSFGKVGIYGHFLVGGLTFHSQIGNSTGTSFAMALGGGLDWWLKPHFGVRPVQFDYLVNTKDTNSAALAGGSGSSQPHSNYRIATGVIFRFGQ